MQILLLGSIDEISSFVFIPGVTFNGLPPSIAYKPTQTGCRRKADARQFCKRNFRDTTFVKSKIFLIDFRLVPKTLSSLFENKKLNLLEKLR